jgi:F-type H+-transporting ATPase subunit delta
MSRVARRYAKALFKLTEGNLKEARQTLSSLEVLEDLFEIENSAKILNSPVMPSGLKRDILDYGLKVGQAGANVVQIVDYIVGSRRESIIPKLVKAFRDLIDTSEGIARGSVTSTVPLNQAEKDLLLAELKHLLHKDVILKEEIDPNLLGGMVAQVGHFLIDMSLKTKLDGIGQHVIQSQIEKTSH